MSFWGQRPHALALVELLQRGELRHRQEQAAAWEALCELGWARRTSRSDALALDQAAQAAVEDTLRVAWPDWREVADRLASAGLPVTPAGLRDLARRNRRNAAGDLSLPGRMNRHTAAALLGPHSKARLGPFEHVVLEATEVTSDGCVRMRPSVGLEVGRGETTWDGRALASLLGEIVVTDRALRDGTRLVGARPRAVLTVENLGSFQDIRVPPDVMVVHVPGWDTRTTRGLLDGLETVPVLHFGDLDPNGVAILAHLRRWRPDVRWLVPSFWESYIAERGQMRQWPPVEFPADAAAWVTRLPERRVWLEQEIVVLDPRLIDAIQAELDEV